MTAVHASGSPDPLSRQTQRQHETSVATRHRRRSRLAAVIAMCVISALVLGGFHQSTSWARQSGSSTPAASPATIETPAPDARRLAVEFTEYNDSGVSGKATFYDVGDRTLVDIDIENAGKDHPAHIHSGQCGTLDPEPAFKLNDVLADGRSRTAINISLDDLLASDYAIDLHLAPDDLGTMIACSDISGEPTTGDATPAPTVENTPSASATTPAATEDSEPTPTAAMVGDGTGGSDNTGVGGDNGGVGDRIPPTVIPAQTVTAQEEATSESPATGSTRVTPTVVAGDGTGTGTTWTPTNSSSSLGSTGTGPLQLVPATPTEWVIWSSAIFAMILFFTGVWIWRGERRLHSSSRQPPRWSRLGM